MIGSRLRYTAFGTMLALPLTMHAVGDPRGDFLTSLVTAIPAGLLLAALFTWSVRSDDDILATMEEKRLNEPNRGKNGPYGPNETPYDPCPSERRLTEHRKAGNRTMMAMAVITVLAVLLTSHSSYPPHRTGIMFTIILGTTMLMIIDKNVQHHATARRQGLPLWEKRYVDDDDHSKGWWFVERGGSDVGIMVGHFARWFVILVCFGLVTGAYWGKTAP